MMDRFERAYVRFVRRPGLHPRVRDAVTFTGALVREALSARIADRAATLVYWTLVAIVPLLAVLAAAMAPVGGTGAVRDLLYSGLLAGPVRAVGDQLDSWLAQVDFASLGAAGVVALVFTASRIYMSVEEAYNALWRVQVERSWLRRLLTFYALLTLSPLLVAYGFHLSAQLRSAVHLGVAARALPVLLTGVAFTAAVKALPSTEVRLGPAALGGFVSAFVFELAKSAFSFYTDWFGAVEAAAAVYGGLALFPVFLLWVYVLWFIVLLGVELAYVAQHIRDFMHAEQRIHEGAAQHPRHPEPFFALKCLLVVVRRFLDGAGPTSAGDVMRTLETEPAQVRAAVSALAKAGLLVAAERGFLPAAPPDTVTARAALDRYRALVRPIGADEGAIDSVVEALLSDRAEQSLAALAAGGAAPASAG
jgi:YihY family inner membrane protein